MVEEIKQKEIGKGLYWTPRILAIIFVIFLSLISLDVFGMQLGFWKTLGAFFMHLIPAFILLIILIISWKKEIVGGIVFIIAGILYIYLTFTNVGNWLLALAWSVQISGVSFVIGGFFIANWIKKKRLLEK